MNRSNRHLGLHGVVLLGSNRHLGLHRIVLLPGSNRLIIHHLLYSTSVLLHSLIRSGGRWMPELGSGSSLIGCPRRCNRGLHRILLLHKRLMNAGSNGRPLLDLLLRHRNGGCTAQSVSAFSAQRVAPH
ncbi:MAG: hypothetical protein PHX60_07120 [Giesbergeria sp.]|uniref:hypothetical protein n=1 Tax=Giesbergeria sp. TaxID=2818473 RepID=UPI002634AD0C|nr:hypothetical protein [Giesbergeria sp.]MDD2609457.1 hypothetical protein [Giesbergeria sp.]